ncbi:MAG TPA: cysteine hydrolase [Candidatus Bathyarchaeota archaeon]|nr:cysteine hydrolase [Candidatus Bathyarchaeota archaeon]
MKAAVLVIDMLNDFVKGSLKVPGASDIVPRIRELLSWARGRGMPVIYANDAHIRGVDAELKLWGQHAIRGTWGALVIDELKPEEGDFVVEKRRYSAFFGTDLDLLLRELGVDTLILTGLVTNVCVQHTAADAFYRGYKLIVVSDCCTALTDEDHEAALEYMRRVYGAEVKSAKELMEGA